MNTAEIDRERYMSVGEISQRLGVVVTAQRLQALGFEPAHIVGNGRFYERATLPAIGQALAHSITELAAA